MTKGEFLMTLRRKLTGEIPPQDVERNLLYYENYITDAVRGGKAEAQILDELGSPLLIAKTIIDTYGAEVGADTKKRSADYAYQREDCDDRETQPHIYRIPSWTGWLLAILLVFLAVTILRVLIPILVPVILVCIVVSWLRRR